MPGEKCPTLASMTINEIHHRVPERQDPSSTKNRALLAAVQRESPVGVVNSVDRQITNASNKTPMTFVGHFVPFEVCAKKRSFGKIVSGLQCTELPSTTHMLNAFDTEKHLNAFKCELPWLISINLPEFFV